MGLLLKYEENITIQKCVYSMASSSFSVPYVVNGQKNELNWQRTREQLIVVQAHLKDLWPLITLNALIFNSGKRCTIAHHIITLDGV